MVSQVASTTYTSTLMDDLRIIYKGDDNDDEGDSDFASDKASFESVLKHFLFACFFDRS